MVSQPASMERERKQIPIASLYCPGQVLTTGFLNPHFIKGLKQPRWTVALCVTRKKAGDEQN
jgi:hypothetical protein